MCINGYTFINGFRIGSFKILNRNLIDPAQLIGKNARPLANGKRFFLEILTLRRRVGYTVDTKSGAVVFTCWAVASQMGTVNMSLDPTGAYA